MPDYSVGYTYAIFLWLFVLLALILFVMVIYGFIWLFLRIARSR